MSVVLGELEDIDAKIARAKKYPMCTRLARNHDKILDLQRFLDWCEEENKPSILLSASSSSGFHGTRGAEIVGRERELLIYKFLEIDPRRLEDERRAMLDDQRKLNAKEI